MLSAMVRAGAASGFNRRAIRLIAGAASLSSSRSFSTLCARSDEPTGQISPRPGQAVDQPVLDRITNERENNRDRSGRFLRGQSAESATAGHNDVHIERYELGRQSGKSLGIALGVPVFDLEVAALDVAEITKLLEKSLQARIARRDFDFQVPDAHDLLGLLRSSGERRGEEGAGRSQEERPSSHHRISSSAT